MEGTLRSPRIRAFLVAEGISATGTFATFIAIWGYAAYEFDATAGDVTLFGVMLTLPGVLLGPAVGAFIDLVGPRTALAVAKVAGVLASLALLFADDFRTLALLSFVHGCVGALTVPALQSLPPRIVDDRDLARTNALVSLTDEFGIVAGPVLGGVAIGWVGFRGAFVIDALTYLLGLVVLPLVQMRPLSDEAADEANAAPRSFRDAFEGLRHVRRTPMLRRLVIGIASVHMLYGAAILAEPLYVRDVLERPPSTFAALQFVFGVFLVVGGVVVASRGERLATFGWVAAGIALSGVSAVVYLGTGFLAVAFAGVVLWGSCTALLSGPSRTLLQRHAPEALHGRVMATDWMASSSAEFVGLVAAGVLVSLFGVPVAITVLGGSVVVVAAVLQVRARRPEPVPQGDPELVARPVG